MARAALCTKCGTVAQPGAAACAKCGTELKPDDGTLSAKRRLPSKPAVPAATREEPSANTRPFKAFTPDATFTDQDHDSRTIDGSADLDAAQRLQLQIKPEGSKVLEPRPPNATAPPKKVNTNSKGPVPGAPLAARRSGALASHQAAVAAAAAAPAPARKDPMLGEKLGEYVIEAKIGVGGMGVVYRARQPLIGTNVAIKVLRGDVIADKRDMERLLDEARVVNAIKHRGIINIFGAGELADGRQYLVMEYLEGETLEARLDREKKLSAEEAIPILDEVCAALGGAHGAGIVHRDLKPANVFLVKQSDGPVWVKLLDFGLARRQQAEVSRIAGTPDYISPEHARGRPAGPPADMYGFGVLAFHLLTGQLPFKGNSPMEMMEQHVHKAPPNPMEVNPSIPSAMSGLILALLEKDPAKRPDAAAARKDLKAAAAQLVALGPDGSTPRDGLAAMTAASSSELDPRMKELARKADVRRWLSLASQNWPWVLAGLGLLWVLIVAIWMLATPSAAPEAGPRPIKKVAPPPKKAAPPPPVEAKPVEAAPPEAPAPETAPPAAPPTEADAERADAVKQRQNLEAAVGRWRAKTKNELDVLAGRLTGDLESYLPALSTLRAEVAATTTGDQMREIDGKVQDLKRKVALAADRQ